MCSPQSDDQPWHADLGSYQIDREPKGQEHAFISLCTNAGREHSRSKAVACARFSGPVDATTLRLVMMRVGAWIYYRLRLPDI